MNPSHFPQVLRSRSRSPSPVSRFRGRSTIEINVTDVNSGTEDDRLRDSHLGDCLSVPKVESPRRGTARSFRHHRLHLPTHNVQTVASELEHMASSEESTNDGSRDASPINESPRQSRKDIWTTRSEGQASQGYGTNDNDRGNNKYPGSSSYTPAMEDVLRRRLKYYFMDPCSKFRARRHWPWKLSVQILKIVLITFQVLVFGAQRSNVVEYFESNNIALKHLLLRNWEAGYETLPYPPAIGAYAVYNKNDLYDSIEYAWSRYYNLTANSLSTIDLVTDDNGTVLPMNLCCRVNNYQHFDNGSYIVDSGSARNCTELHPIQNGNKTEFNIRKYLHNQNLSIPFSRLLDLTLEFMFTTFHLNLIETHYGPTCYNVNATIKFANNERSGQAMVTLDTLVVEKDCSGKIMSEDAAAEESMVKQKNVAFDAVVIVICLLSTILCFRSLVRGWKLKQKTEKFFKIRHGKKLTFSERMEFVNLWYFLIITNDIFTIIGSSFKIQLETRSFSISSANYDVCSLFLGLGGLMAWIGVLRYLGFFKKYNILLLTLKTAFPNVLRFSVCALALYFGYMFCGWVILGPYHVKFRRLSTTSECLFALINGDDMFVTFSATETSDNLIWYFSRIYVYTFCSLFIYCVLSLFISVIMDTYERLKECQEFGHPKSDLEKFIDECNDPLHSGLYTREHTDPGSECMLFSCFNCCKRNTPDIPNEHSSLLTRTV